MPDLLGWESAKSYLSSNVGIKVSYRRSSIGVKNSSRFYIVLIKYVNLERKPFANAMYAAWGCV